MTTRQLQRDQTLPLFAKGVACETTYLSRWLSNLICIVLYTTLDIQGGDPIYVLPRSLYCNTRSSW